MNDLAIDAHQHYWTLGETEHDWSATVDTASLARSFGPDDLDPDRRAAGVDATVVMQSANNTRETEQLLALAARTPWVAGVVGWVSLVDADDRARSLEILTGDPGFCGVRHLTNVERRSDWVSQPAVLSGLGDLARRGIAFDAVPETPEVFERVIEIAKRVPDLKVVLDHLARPPLLENGWEPWATLIVRAAACPNVAIKASVGLDVVRRWAAWNSAELRPYLLHAVEAFGASRVLAASNWPVVLLAGDYRTVWDETRALLAGGSRHELAAMLGGNTATWYSLRAPTAS